MKLQRAASTLDDLPEFALNALRVTTQIILLKALRFIPILTLFLPVLAVAADAPSGKESSPQLKVLVGREVPRAIISGRSLKIVDGDGWTHSCGERVSVRASGENRFAVSPSSRPLAGPLRISSVDGAITVDRGPFRGSIELVSPGSRRMNVINLVGLEDYLCGVVNAEIMSTWPIEAVKAQVVAARTYALRRMLDSGGAYHLTATTDDQVYRGRSIEDSNAARAVRETAGRVMTHGEEPILAYYHACCGGATDSAADIKDRDLPYTASATCRWCGDAPSYRWDYTIAARELARLIAASGKPLKQVDRIVPRRVTQSGRILELDLVSGRGTVTITGEELRRIIGYQKLKSTRFVASRVDGGFHFRGTGHGHGIGACQWGMRRMAENGYSWREILRHYYKDITFSRLR